jgi:excisionase family DNA binding protein
MSSKPATEQSRITLWVNEAAEALGISSRPLFTLLKSGEIPHSKINRAVLIRVSDLEEFIQRQQVRK